MKNKYNAHVRAVALIFDSADLIAIHIYDCQDSGPKALHARLHALRASAPTINRLIRIALLEVISKRIDSRNDQMLKLGFKTFQGSLFVFPLNYNYSVFLISNTNII